jgi:hypothetical protein
MSLPVISGVDGTNQNFAPQIVSSIDSCDLLCAFNSMHRELSCDHTTLENM